MINYFSSKLHRKILNFNLILIEKLGLNVIVVTKIVRKTEEKIRRKLRKEGDKKIEYIIGEAEYVCLLKI